jgi:translocation and assembly module TamB
LLSGRVVVERLLMMEGLDLGAVMTSSRETVRGSTTGSAFLRNLQFDIEAISSADARLEWNAARFESEAALRVRGTAEHPVLLGHVHLLAGEMDFRGNRYRLTRGDMNFSNPFRLDPVIDVEATTTIQQYEVTIQLSGPASHLSLNYRSDPPLPPGDVITLLALGHTGAESQLRRTGASGAADVGARAVLSEAISSQLGGRIEKFFGVSRFRVDPAFSGVGADQNATARITIEQRVTRELTITYVTNVTSTQRQVFQIEYNVSRDLAILALRDENGTFGLDIKRTKRFK